MSRCDECKRFFGIQRGKSSYCSSCPNYTQKLISDDINNLNAQLDEAENEGGGDMAVDYGSEKYQGKYLYLPKMGEEARFDIKEIREVQSDNAKFNFSENVPVLQEGVQVIDDDGEPVFKKKDLGYHIEAELTNGKILSVTSFPAFLSVFKANNIQDGEKVLIKHIAKGEWEVIKE